MVRYEHLHAGEPATSARQQLAKTAWLKAVNKMVAQRKVRRSADAATAFDWSEASSRQTTPSVPTSRKGPATARGLKRRGEPDLASGGARRGLKRGPGSAVGGSDGPAAGRQRRGAAVAARPSEQPGRWIRRRSAVGAKGEYRPPAPPTACGAGTAAPPAAQRIAALLSQLRRRGPAGGREAIHAPPCILPQ